MTAVAAAALAATPVQPQAASTQAKGADSDGAFASLLDSLPHGAANKARAGAEDAEASEEQAEAKPQKSEANVRASLESVLSLSFPQPVALTTGTAPTQQQAPSPLTPEPAAAAYPDGKTASLVAARPGGAVSGAALVGERTFLAPSSGPAAPASVLSPAAFGNGAASAATAAQAVDSLASTFPAGGLARDAATLPPAMTDRGAPAALTDQSTPSTPNTPAAAPASATTAKPAVAPAARAGSGSGASRPTSDTSGDMPQAAAPAQRAEQAPATSSGTGGDAAAGSGRQTGASADPSGAGPASVNPAGPLAATAFLPPVTVGASGASASSVSQPAQASSRTGESAAARPTSAVREIDVDLASGGVADASMTLRLAGDRLSVVIRAASGEAARAIEGARDSIVDRLSAIGQPVASLIIQQTGANADGKTDAKDTSGGGSRPQGQGQAQGGGSGDARSDRRGGAARGG